MAAKNGDWIRITTSIYHVLSKVGGKEYESSILIYNDSFRRGIVCPCHTCSEEECRVEKYPFITPNDLDALAKAIKAGGIGEQSRHREKVIKALVKDMIEWYLVRNS